MDPQSTVGAGKSGAQTDKRFGPDNAWFALLALIILLLISPIGAVIALVASQFGQRRRVPRRVAVFAATVTLIVLVMGSVAGAGPLTFSWHVDFMRWLAEVTGLTSGVNWVSDNVTSFADKYLGLSFGLPTITHSTMSAGEALWAGLPFGAVFGLWLGAAQAGWAVYRQRPLERIEERVEPRPEGATDKARAKVSAQRITAGRAARLNRKTHGQTGTVGVGVGAYGALLTIDVATLMRPTLVFGGPRTGKTRFTMSLLGQAASCGSGVLVIDYKGDEEVPEFWAEFAHTHSRRFLHMQTADKNGAPYKPPHPSAPQEPAFYDPMLRGNATSRVEMLVNSVVEREGDAAAYKRAAYEVGQVAFAVAEATGYDMDKGTLPAMVDLLDFDTLQRVADTKGPDGRPLLADSPEITARVSQLVATKSKDDVLRGAVNDLHRLISTRMVGPAIGPWLRPGPPEQTIDLVRACLEGDVVVFSLSVQEYGDLARDVGTLALLDLQNAIAVLRRQLGKHRAEVGDPLAPPPWSPMYVEIEEFGSAGPKAVLGVLNKSGDVQVRPFLSTQSLSDVIAVDGTGVFVDRVFDQAGNVFCFDINEEKAANRLSGMTKEMHKMYGRSAVEFRGGLMGMGVRAANLGEINKVPVKSRQVPPGAFQNQPRFSMIWLSNDPATATHSFKARPNHWYETIRSVMVPPDAGRRYAPTAEDGTAGPDLADIDDRVDVDDMSVTTVLPPNAAPAAAPAPAQEPPAGETPPFADAWDDVDDGLDHEQQDPPATATTRPAPPPSRTLPAWEKEWRSPDEAPGGADTAPIGEGATSTDAHPEGLEDPPEGDGTGSGEHESTPRDGDPRREGPEVTRTPSTVSDKTPSSGFLDLDGFDSE